ncbi:SDR family oxidoreductase [Bacillus pumilus]|uniref:SDR family NAD(P)-dependent oxidoreductase n=1 Tax=Bacillus pumilus TaxID=1408 RepID=UPI001CFBB276|nr:SDR family oxidoreductase [Bacillus pumilus]UCZ69513.1 SDR family oxidoreductase [Bacillus pumilus]
MGRLTGKRIWITGASGGIGEKMAYLAAEEGAEIIISARRIEKLTGVKEKIMSAGGVCHIVELDVSHLEDIDRAYQEVGAVDILVNNAGFGAFDLVEDASIEEMVSMFEVNVFGLIACTKKVIPEMKQRGHGHIINIASQAGKIATPKSAIYSASKHAVLGFSNSLRMELADFGIHVTTVNPGPIATDFFTIADRSGEYVKNVEFMMLSADKVAGKVVSAMMTNKREINLPGWMNAGSKLYQLFPFLFEKAARKAMMKK